jgi:hypothetical protein
LGACMSGFSENVSFVDDVTNGVTTTLHFQGESLIVQKTWDAQPWLKAAAEERAATQHEGWGEGRKVFTLPPAEYGRFLKETQNKTQKEKQNWLKTWAIQNPLLVGYERYIKR